MLVVFFFRFLMDDEVGLRLEMLRFGPLTPLHFRGNDGRDIGGQTDRMERKERR
jgi:hypothetical protein